MMELPPEKDLGQGGVGAFTGIQPRTLHCSHMWNQPYVWDLLCFKSSWDFLAI